MMINNMFFPSNLPFNQNGGFNNIPQYPNSGMGNILPIGGNNYYNGMTPQYYNPYLFQKQEEERRILEQEQIRQQTDMVKSISRSANKAMGMDDDYISKHVKIYDPIEVNPEEVYREQVQCKLYSLFSDNVQNTIKYDEYLNNIMAQEISRTRMELPNDMCLAEFFEKAGNILFRTEMAEKEAEMKNISKLYNSDQYKQLINLHSSGNNYMNTMYNRGINPPVNLDDMEISIPTSTIGKYHKRREEFFKSFMKGDM